MASVEGHMKMTPVTTLNESLADPRDMFAAHTMFRREFGLMLPGQLGGTELVKLGIIERRKKCAAVRR